MLNTHKKLNRAKADRLPSLLRTRQGAIAERIRREFNRECFFPAPGQEVHLTISAGVAQHRNGEEMKSFVHRVDKFMYQTKKSGKDGVCAD